MVGYGMYLSFKKQWEPLTHVDYVFMNDKDYTKKIKEIVQFLKEKINS